MYHNDKDEVQGEEKAGAKAGSERVLVSDRSGRLRQCPQLVTPPSVRALYHGTRRAVLLVGEGASFLFTPSSALCFGQWEESRHGSSRRLKRACRVECALECYYHAFR